jgi:site-specific recombinase XerD
MGAISDRMDGDLRLRGLAEVTRAEYLRCARQFVAHYRLSPDRLGGEEVRRYLLHLIEDRHFSPSNMKIHIAAIKFLFAVTLDRPDVVDKVKFPKVPQKLLDIPSPSEVAAVLSELRVPMYRAVLYCAYGAGLRVSEACKLCVGDIDAQRMVLIVRDGKGGRDRYAMLSPVLLDLLRRYYKVTRPPLPYLFQGRIPGRPVPVEGVQTALRMALRRSGVAKRITPHSLRHAFATHSLESGTDLRVIQVLLGHANIRATVRYVHVSTATIAAARSPLDAIASQIQHATT